MIRPKAFLLGAAFLVMATTSAAAQKTSLKVAPMPPPYVGSYQPQGVDELGMWREDDESERALTASPLVIRDAALNSYVRGVLCATIGAERCKSVRTYILRVPIFNASMSPNGTMRIYSGLLLRARSEAELAAVLGHEFGHFEQRHTLQRFKAARTGSDMLSWAAVLTSMAGTRQAHDSFQTMQVTVLGGLMRFNRDHEREADLLGLGYLNAGSLRPHSASRMWRNLILETEASSAARGLKKPDFKRVAFFASHPPEGERVDYLYALAAPDGEGREDGAERYAAAMAPWTGMFLDDQVALNDFGGSDFLITRLAENGWTADLWRARGDLFRQRGHPRDLMNAADYYGKAVALAPDLAVAQRGLGLSLVKTGRVAEGRAALERYLALAPKAQDAEMMGMTVASLGGAK